MAEAERKDIAQLDFNIQAASQKLDELNSKLETISNKSESYAKRIGQNIGKSINGSIGVNTDDVEKQLMDVHNLSKNQLGKTTSYVIKENSKRISSTRRRRKA